MSLGGVFGDVFANVSGDVFGDEFQAVFQEFLADVFGDVLDDVFGIPFGVGHVCIRVCGLDQVLRGGWCNAMCLGRGDPSGKIAGVAMTQSNVCMGIFVVGVEGRGKGGEAMNQCNARASFAGGGW